MTANELLAEMHPGRTVLEDVVKPPGMSVNALAKKLHVPATRLNDSRLMLGRCEIQIAK